MVLASTAASASTDGSVISDGGPSTTEAAAPDDVDNIDAVSFRLATPLAHAAQWQHNGLVGGALRTLWLWCVLLHRAVELRAAAVLACAGGLAEEMN